MAFKQFLADNGFPQVEIVKYGYTYDISGDGDAKGACSGGGSV
jgi:hypothetical protein